MQIQELLSQTSKLPSIPEVVRELVQALNNPNVNYSLLADKVSKDQTLSLKILRLVNSAHFGLSRKVGSIDEATVMLGMEKLKVLVIASGFSGSAPKTVEGIDIKKFWSDSFTVAALARWFAKHSEGVEPDMAFTAGIVHNIGRLLLHLASPNRAMAIQTLIEQEKVSRTDAEMERLGFTTPQAGQALLSLWKFPPELGQAVCFYKRPLKADANMDLACVLHLACYINAARREKHSLEQVMEHFPFEVAAGAGIAASIVEQLKEAMMLESGLDGLNG